MTPVATGQCRKTDVAMDIYRMVWISETNFKQWNGGHPCHEPQYI